MGGIMFLDHRQTEGIKTNNVPWHNILFVTNTAAIMINMYSNIPNS